ncbi:hypothetical protein F7734_55010 [Scytonema sp. UIC 10036]|uniref:hypothetical protein n=1 Tax=Scytonema sp. UIC 10036 TaxID=2304196 RepID=UPI0012DA6324|nr:hypothetical protein [Scytonema sp. UIC 10036]MUH00900.1 hypothetical protein [Scytonema sp. UIC 10036]
MAASEELANFLMGFVNSVRTRSLEWKQEKLGEIIEIQRRSATATRELHEELKKKEAILKYEIDKINVQGEAELQMLKDKYNQEINDYKEFLKAIDELKDKLKQSYSQMPLTLILSVHRHAKHLLNSMWEASDIEDKILLERKFTKFLVTIHEDTTLLLNASGNPPTLPQKTIDMMNEE